jgi:phosphatidate phosphatase APP1
MTEIQSSGPQAQAEHGNMAMRAEDRFQTWRSERRLKAGATPVAKMFYGYGDGAWARVLARVVIASPRAKKAAPFEAASKVVRDGIRGWRNFVDPPQPGARVTVEIAGETHEARADRGGVIDVVLPAALPFGWHPVVVTPEGGVPAKGEVRVVDPSLKFGVVSDIDDTVMVTSVPRPMLAAWNTFILDEHARTPIPGMPVLYERLTLSKDVGLFVYLSTGPWNVASTLKRFLQRNLYPKAPVLLTDWGPTPNRLFRSGRDHKVSQLRRLAEEFPEYRWILIGDDGQHDEEIYSWFAETYPTQVELIVIRQLSPSEAMLAGGRSLRARESATGSTAPWVYAPDGAAMAVQLAQLGYIQDADSTTEHEPAPSSPQAPSGASAS